MRITIPLLVAVALASSGCIYKLDVQQGNVVTQDSVAKLKKGMTKSEVRNTLGTPLLMDPFHGNRWDYYFSTLERGKTIERTRFSVFFDNDRLVSVTGDIKAANTANAPTVPAASASPSTATPAPAASTPVPKAPAPNTATK